MDNKELIKSHENDIRAYEESIAEIEQLMWKLKRKIENQEETRNNVIKEKNKMVSFIEKNSRKSSNLSLKFPRTRFVVGVSRLMENFEQKNNNSLINSFDRDIKAMKKEILDNYDLLDTYEREIASYRDKVNYCYTEIDYLRSK